MSVFRDLQTFCPLRTTQPWRNTHRAGWLALALALGTPAVLSAEAELDTDLMQSIEDTNKSLASAVALRDGKAAQSDAAELHAMFLKVSEFYATREDADDARALSQKSQELALKIQQQVKAGDFSSAINTSTDLSRTCKTCHNFYKKS